MLCSKAEEVHRMKLEVAIIERKEQLDDLIPFRVENALWGTEKFPPMYGYRIYSSRCILFEADL